MLALSALVEQHTGRWAAAAPEGHAVQAPRPCFDAAPVGHRAVWVMLTLEAGLDTSVSDYQTSF